MENVRKHQASRNIKLVTTKARRIHFMTKPNYHAAKKFSNNLLATEMKKTQILMSKPVYLGLLVLEISKIVIYEF